LSTDQIAHIREVDVVLSAPNLLRTARHVVADREGELLR
jgi:hypothetical protein